MWKYIHALRRNTDQNNRITLDNKIKDSNGVPISNLYYKKSYKSSFC